MKTPPRLLGMLLCMLLANVSKTFATVYTSVATGIWSNTANWSPPGLPGAADNVVIKHGTIITVDGAYSCNNLTIGDATSGVTTLQITAAANSLNIRGALSMNPNSLNNTYTLNAGPGSISVSGTFPTWCSSTGTNSLKVSTGSLSFTPAITISSIKQNITCTGAGTVNFNSSFTDNANKLVTFAACTVNFAGAYTVSTVAASWAGMGTAVFTTASTITANSNLTLFNVQTSASATATLAAAAGTVIIGGAITLGTGSTLTAQKSFELNGNWTNNGGTFIGGANNIILNGNTTVNGATDFPVIQVGSTTASVTTAVTLNSSITCTGVNIKGFNNARTFSINSGDTLTVHGNVTIASPTAAVTNNLAVNAGTCIISGNLSLADTATMANYKAAVTVTSGSLNISGNISWANNSLAANQVVTLSTGKINFTNPVNLLSGTLAVTSAGTLNFNGSAVSLTIGGGANSPVFTAANGSTLNFSTGITNNTGAITLGSTSTSCFTGNATITPTAAITFGNMQINAGVNCTLAGNIIVAGNWVNNGGALSGGSNTIFFTGNNKTIGGTTSTSFPGVQLGNSTSGTVLYTLNKSATCTSMLFYAGANPNTLTVAAASDTLTISGDLTMHQPTAANTNLLTNNGIINITGDLYLGDALSTAGCIAKLAVGNGSSALTLNGNLMYGSNATASNEVLSLGTGTINFQTPVNLASGTFQFTGAGTVNFNGAAPSWSFGGANAPVFTTVANCSLNTLQGFTINSALVLNASSKSNFNGAGSITPNAAITFGKLTINSTDTLQSGSTVIIAGIFTLASGAVFYANQNFEADGNWINNGGQLTGTTYTVYLNGTGQVISGQPTAFQTLQIGNSTSAVNVAVTMSCNNSATAFVMQSGNNSRTFTITSGDSLTVNGDVTINQPAANVINNLSVAAGVCVITGALNFAGNSNINTQVARVSVTSGSLSLAGAINWMSNTTVATELITLSTGQITFLSSVSMPGGSGSLQVTGTGTINFNGVATPSFSFGGAASAPVFTTANGCTVNFYHGITNSTNTLGFASQSTSVFTASATVTPGPGINFGHFIINPGVNVTMAGNINVAGNWTDNGSFTPGTHLVNFNGSNPTTQNINATSTELFYQLGGSVSGSTVKLNTNVTVANRLNMTGSSFNLNGNTLTLGNGNGASLNHAANQVYGGTFKRYLPAGTAITASSGSYYGLLPVGTSVNYNPVAITSTANATTGGYISAVYNSSTNISVVSYTDNESSAIQEISLMNQTLTTTGLAGGAYNMAITYNGFANTGATTDLKLETYTGSVMGSAGTSAATTGTVPNPTLYRNGLTAAQLANIWVVGSQNLNNTPLQYFYYSRKSGNWDDVTVGNSTWSYTSGGAGTSCNCIPPANAYVTISPGQTVTVNVNTSADYMNVSSGGTLNDNAAVTLTCNKNLVLNGNATLANTGTWNITGNATFSGSSVCTASGNVTITGSTGMPAGCSYTQNSGTLSLGGTDTLSGIITLGPANLSLTGAAATLSGTGSIQTTGAGTVIITNGKTIPAGSSLTFGSGAQPLTVTISGAQNINNYGTVTVNGDMAGTVAGSTFTNQAGASLFVTGNLLTTGSLSAESSSSTVVYNGPGNQTINPSTLGYANLTIANGGIKSLTTNITVSGILTISDSSVLDEGIYVAGGAANLNMDNTAQLRMARSANATVPELTGVLNLAGGTITINQTAGTAYLAAGAYYNLNLTGTSVYDLTNLTGIAHNFYVTNSSLFVNNPVITITDSLIYTSTASSTLGNNIRVGSFTQTAGTLNDGGYSITVTGAAGWNNNGGIYVATGTVVMNSAHAQVIGGSASTTFATLTINTIAGVTLDQNQTVNTTLNLSKGNLYTSSSALLTMLAGTNYTGGATYSYISGPMVKVGNDDFIFPIGKGSSFGRAGVSGITDPTTVVTAEYFNTPYADSTDIDGTLKQVSRKEYWLIERTVSSDSLQLQLFWNLAEQSSIFNCNTLTIAHFTGGHWTNEAANTVGGSLCSGYGSGSVQTVGMVGSFSPFTFGSGDGNALPVTLVSFNATPLQNTVVTSWITEMEKNNDYFTIERSDDALHFTEAGVVKGSGNSTVTHTYKLIDRQPLTGKSYYRLKQTDNNGQSTFSNIVPVDFNSNQNIQVYPNPCKGVAHVYVAKPGSLVSIAIYDLLGAEVMKCQYMCPDKSAPFNLALQLPVNLARGIYMVRAETDDFANDERLVVE